MLYLEPIELFTFEDRIFDRFIFECDIQKGKSIQATRRLAGCILEAISYDEELNEQE